MAHYLFVVFTDAHHGRDEEFNAWYSDHHLADVLGVPGFVAAQRFVCEDQGRLPGRYLALYEVETDDPEKALNALKSAGLHISDAMDRSRLAAVFFKPMGERKTSTSLC